MFSSTPLAPSMEVSSSSGDEIARCAASSARFSPLAMPVPISAMPMPVMIVLTSAKSTFTSPGTVIRSEMPCTAWRSTSSAIRKASVSGVPRSTKESKRSFGMVIRVSTEPRSSSMPRSASCMRRRPSKPKGLVTTATVSAPISAANEAMIGAAPVPVPPPRPAVMNTMSEPSSSSRMCSVSSSAALRPISGSPPTPRPRVRVVPTCSLVGATVRASDWASVLALMNSMPRSSAAIMRLTALPPPPPTPTTLILAGMWSTSGAVTASGLWSVGSSKRIIVSSSLVGLTADRKTRCAASPSGCARSTPDAVGRPGTARREGHRAAGQKWCTNSAS